MKREDDGPDSLIEFLTAPTPESPAAPMKKPATCPVAGLKSGSIRMFTAPVRGTANRAYTRSLQPPMRSGCNEMPRQVSSP